MDKNPKEIKKMTEETKTQTYSEEMINRLEDILMCASSSGMDVNEAGNYVIRLVRDLEKNLPGIIGDASMAARYAADSACLDGWEAVKSLEKIQERLNGEITERP